MTREELEKEAKVFATYYESLFPDEFETFYKAFLKVAEPREERISELDKENGILEGKLADLQSEYFELENFKNNEIKELKERLTKAKQLLAFWVNNFYDAFNKSIKYDERHKALVETEQFLKEADQ